MKGRIGKEEGCPRHILPRLYMYIERFLSSLGKTPCTLLFIIPKPGPASGRGAFKWTYHSAVGRATGSRGRPPCVLHHHRPSCHLLAVCTQNLVPTWRVGLSIPACLGFCQDLVRRHEKSWHRLGAKCVQWPQGGLSLHSSIWVCLCVLKAEASLKLPCKKGGNKRHM